MAQLQNVVLANRIFSLCGYICHPLGLRSAYAERQGMAPPPYTFSMVIRYIVMADTMTKEQRHKCMAAVKSKDTKPEMLVRRYLHAHGWRYGLHNRKLPGCPDLVFRQIKTVVFIHGCFWHGHKDCKYFRLPKSNEDFWKPKIERNIDRDAKVKEELERQGWNVIVVWECDLKNKSLRETTLDTLNRTLFHLRNRTYAHPCYPFAEAAEPESPYGSI